MHDYMYIRYAYVCIYEPISLCKSMFEYRDRVAFNLLIKSRSICDLQEALTKSKDNFRFVGKLLSDSCSVLNDLTYSSGSYIRVCCQHSNYKYKYIKSLSLSFCTVWHALSRISAVSSYKYP